MRAALPALVVLLLAGPGGPVLAEAPPAAGRATEGTAGAPLSGGDLPVYVVERIEVRGNTKTRDYVVRRALKVQPGEALAVDDPRFDLSRFSVLALGFFSDVRLTLEKGRRPGRVVLVVTVVERGTIVLTDLWLGTSEATRVWGGMGLAENNFMGHGVRLAGRFLLGSDPLVEEARVQQAYAVDASLARPAGLPLYLGVGGAFRDGSEFFRKSGPESTSDPEDFVAIRVRRAGGNLHVGLDLFKYTRLLLEYRGEWVHADLPDAATRTFPDGSTRPIAFGIKDGTTVLSMVGAGVVRDSRSDPVLPHAGSLLSFSAQVSAAVTGSSYDFVKLTARYRHYFPLSWGHVLSAQLFGGAVLGEAPFFENFFIGDINDLVPSRAMGLAFSTLPSRDIFNTSIDEKRYEEIAARAGLEYIIPWFRGGKFFYGGDFFVNVGVFLLTSRDAIRARDRDLAEAIPVDLTLDAGLRLDTRVGVFRLSLGNALGRIPF